MLLPDVEEFVNDHYRNRPAGEAAPSIDGLRAMVEKRGAEMPRLGAEYDDLRTEDVTIPGDAGEISARVYFPPTRSTTLPTMVLFHGGGWIMGSVDFNDQMARSLCLGTNSVVVNSGYRLAPEHQFPAAVDDASAAVRWAFENVAELGGDVRRIGVAGISAGANLAAVAALDAADAGLDLAVQVLIVPTLDAGREYPSKSENGEGFGLTAKELEFSNETYCPTSRGLDRDPRRSPMYASDETLARTAPAVIAVSEHDVVRDEGLAYADRLSQAGNPARTLHNKGMIHNVSDVFTTVPSVRQAIETTWEAARDILGDNVMEPREVVREYIDRISKADFASALELFDDDVRVQDRFSLPLPRELPNKAAALAAIENGAVHAPGEELPRFYADLEVRDLVIHEMADPNQVVAEWTYVTRIGDATVENHNVSIVTCRGGKILHSRDYHNHVTRAVAEGTVPACISAIEGMVLEQDHH